MSFSLLPMDHIGSSDFLRRQDVINDGYRMLDDWLGGDLTKEPEFRKYCDDPVINYDDEASPKRWSASFYVFNHKGGVNRVVAFGDINPFSLEDIKISVVQEDGYFFFPEIF